MASNYDKHIFRQLEDVLKKCDSLSQEIKDLKEQHKQEIYELNQKHEKEVKALNDKIDSLEKENAELKEKVDVLEGKSNQKNSTNSSTPPSKDEYKTQNHREKSNRKQGGQKGRKGKTLTAEEVEKLIKDKKAEVREEHYGNGKKGTTTIKYIMDVETKVIIRKIFIHGDIKNSEVPEECKIKSTVIYGNNLKALVGVMYAQEVIAFDRMSEFLSILTENVLKVSHGSLVKWVHEISQKCKRSKKKLKKAIRKSKIIYTDATPTSLNGKYAYERNYSNESITILEASMSKRIQEIQRQNILPNNKNYIMHDHETGLYNFGIKSHHLECWIHLGRELKYFDEYIGNSWSKELWEFAWNINKKREERLKFIEKIMQDIRTELKKEKIEAEVTGRAKHLYSIYRKMKRDDKTLDQIYDLFALRILVNSVKDCYASLGVVHELYNPMPGRFKDYIAMPKGNMYQSLHTSVIGPRQKPVRERFRCRIMYTWPFRWLKMNLRDATTNNL